MWVCCGIVLLTWIGGCSEENDSETTFPQPEVRQSAHGVLQTTLEVQLARNTIVDAASGEVLQTVETPTYEGALTGPTLRVKSGDTLSLDVINNLPINPAQTRRGAFPHDRYTTNLHTHGLSVSPLGTADNVFRRMLPQTTNRVEITLPPWHQAGTFWYHPHKHGATSFQFFGGMAGFLIVEGGTGTLDEVPQVQAAREVLMAFQVIRVNDDGIVPWVNLQAEQFAQGGLWSPYQETRAYVTTNGHVNPTVRMQPGEVQRWRLLNATAGLSLLVRLQETSLHVIANDGITVPQMLSLPPDEPYVLGAGNRVDVLVRAGAPGRYLLQAIDPTAAPYSVSPQGIAPGIRNARLGGDFPPPRYPITLARIDVAGAPRSMALPDTPLPVPTGLPRAADLLEVHPDAVRMVAFEACGQQGNMSDPTRRLPSCAFFFDRYNADYWGGMAFANLLLMRDADDEGVPVDPTDRTSPHTDYKKEGLFTADRPLFDNMWAGNIEEWTLVNRTFSDHPFHIHQNPFLVTHINGEPLPVPEWRDTILVPAAIGGNGNINEATFGTVTFRTRFDPNLPGMFVMHCHILTHEDVGMMQALEVQVR